MLAILPLLLDIADLPDTVNGTSLSVLGWIVGILAALLVINGAIALIIVLAIRAHKRKNAGK